MSSHISETIDSKLPSCQILTAVMKRRHGFRCGPPGRLHLPTTTRSIHEFWVVVHMSQRHCKWAEHILRDMCL
jgi:hypothetical protein